jgi:hypothetical protein
VRSGQGVAGMPYRGGGGVDQVEPTKDNLIFVGDKCFEGLVRN